MPRAMSHVFSVLLTLLLASFFLVSEQHQRNWLLYLAAAAAHGVLFDRQSRRATFSGPAGWAVPALLAVPVLSLAWSASVNTEAATDLLLAGYCLVMVYLGIVQLVRRDPQQVQAMALTLLFAANLGALWSLGHWAVGYDPAMPRLIGTLGLDNPVHGSILLLATTLPVWNGFAERRLRGRWLCACLAPCAFALLAGPRTALVAYLVVVAFSLRRRFPPGAIVAASVLAGLVAVAALLGNDALRAIWLDRGLSFRPPIWAAAWSAFMACNPLIGCGIATPLQFEYFPGVVTDRAHSLYVALVYHQGVLGTLAFVAVTARLLGGAPPPVTGMAPKSHEATPPGAHAPALKAKVGWLRGLTRRARPVRAALPGQRRDWVLMLAYALLASTTSGDHILVRATLFWCYFWVPVMVLAASARAVVSDRESWPANPA